MCKAGVAQVVAFAHKLQEVAIIGDLPPLSKVG
jgi:hypothetical protein